MRIGVTYEDGNIFQHFGHTEQFKLYDVENEKIKSIFSSRFIMLWLIYVYGRGKNYDFR